MRRMVIQISPENELIDLVCDALAKDSKPHRDMNARERFQEFLDDALQDIEDWANGKSAPRIVVPVTDDALELVPDLPLYLSSLATDRVAEARMTFRKDREWEVLQGIHDADLLTWRLEELGEEERVAAGGREDEKV